MQTNAYICLLYTSVEDVTSLFDAIPGFEQCEANDAEEWLNCDVNDQGFQIVTDEEIADAIIESEALVCEESEEEVTTEEGLYHSGAFKALETAMSWLEKQPYSTPTQLVF